MLPSAPHDTDIALWATAQARLLQEKRFDEIDLHRVAGEIEDIAARQRDTLQERLDVLVCRLLLWKYLPGARLPAWRADAMEKRREIARLLTGSPSLAGSLADLFGVAYRSGRLRAAAETGIDVDLLPPTAPFTLAQARDETFMPVEPDIELVARGP